MITNDMARVYPDGSFVIKGRKDNVVISGGVKLFPEIIEKKIEGLCRKPFYLTGVEDDKLGQKLVMVIESADETDTEMLLDKIKKVVDKYEVPKRIVTVERFVRTESGKIKRAVFS
jgi:O-succinylbenzoic acid--CoA ligase